MSPLAPLLAFLPILVLLLVSLWKGVREAILTGFALTLLLFFQQGGELPAMGASLVSALLGTVQILMIIFGALLLYQVMAEKGFIEGIKDSLAQVHPDRQVRLFFLALFLTAFFESVAGFGTPGAIVPLLLIGLGFSPVLSIAVVLLYNGFFAVSGAVGVPVSAGLQLPLGLDAATVGRIYGFAGLAVLLAGGAVMAFVYRYLRQETGEKGSPWGWAMFGVIMLSYAGLAPWLQELTGIAAAVVLALFAYLFVFQDRRLQVRPWLPYLLLVGLLLMPKLIPPLGAALSWKWELLDLFGTGIAASLQPLRSPLIPFLAVSVFALALSGNRRLTLRPVFAKSLSVFIILFPSLAITQLMLNSGAGGPSMIDHIAGVFVQAGGAYPAISPFIGVVGAFMTGSTTVSNVIFGPVQLAAAQELGFSTPVILGEQLAGASLGNAVCLFNIIAAAAVAGVKDFQLVLRKTLLPVLVASLLVALLGYGWLAWG